MSHAPIETINNNSFSNPGLHCQNTYCRKIDRYLAECIAHDLQCVHGIHIPMCYLYHIMVKVQRNMNNLRTINQNWRDRRIICTSDLFVVNDSFLAAVVE